MIRHKWAAALTLWLSVSGVTPAQSSDERTSERPAVAAACEIGVTAIVPLPSSDEDHAGATGSAYAAILSSPRGPSAATGSLWINTSGGAFLLAFEHRKVLPTSLEGEIDPIAFRVPPNALLQNAFVSELAGHDATPNVACAIFNPWTYAAIRNVSAERMQQFNAAPHTAIADAQSIADPVTACKAPDVPARPVHVEPPETPPIAQQQGITGVVSIAVRLDANGDVVATNVVASASPLLVRSALNSARTTTYQAAIERCRPISGTYPFQVEFNRSR